MHIVIDIPGSVNYGLESPERGESRWAQNWARLLAQEGHQVTCICGAPAVWGNTSQVKNCTLRLFNSKDRINCDIFMHTAWWKGRDIGNINSKIYVHLNYSFEPHLADESFILKNHIIAYPYELSRKNFFHEKNPFTYKTFCLPVPLCESFKDSAFKNNEITFSAKDMFLDRYYPNNIHWLKAARNTIAAMIKLAEKYDLKCNFMMAEQLLDIRNKAIHEYDVINLIKSSKNKTLFNKMPLRDVYRLLEKSKTVLPVISPGGSMIEAVTYGIVPLVWSGSLFDEPAKEYGCLTNEFAEYEEIENQIEKIITDENLYLTLLKRYQDILKGHLYSNSVKFFEKVVNFSE